MDNSELFPNKEAAIKAHKKMVRGIAYSPDGKLIGTASQDKTFRLWDARTFKLIRSHKQHLNWVTDIVFLNDNKTVVTASHDNTIVFWDIASGEKRRVIDRADPSNKYDRLPDIDKLILSKDGSLLASTGNSKPIHIWDTQTGELVETIMGEVGDTGISFTSKSNYLGVKHWRSKTTTLYYISNGNYAGEVQGFKNDSAVITFSPCGNYLAAKAASGKLGLWITYNWSLYCEFSIPHDDAEFSPHTIAFDSNSDLLIAASIDRVYAWAIEAQTNAVRFLNPMAQKKNQWRALVLTRQLVFHRRWLERHCEKL